MTKRSETRKLEAKKREWDEALRGFNRAYNKMKREINYNLTNWLEWYFGDKNQKGVPRYMRRISILAVDIILLRILNLI